MSIYVVDASVALKWFITEVHTADALRLRSSSFGLHVPTLFDVEMANIVWKKSQRGELSSKDSTAIVHSLSLLPVTRHDILGLLDNALDLAIQTQQTVYDCLYLTLAIQIGGLMVTADQRFVHALQSTPFATHVLWVEDLP